MTHKCPRQRCEDCWEEGKALALILFWVGLLVAMFALAGCASVWTSDCARDEHGVWRCHDRQPNLGLDRNEKVCYTEGEEDNMKRIDIATPEETLETELAIIQGAGIKVRHVGFQRGLEGGFHLYDVLEPKVPGYTYNSNTGLPTLSLDGMKRAGLI